MRNILQAIYPVIIIISLLLFLIYRPLPGGTVYWVVVQNIGHIPLFGVISIAIFLLFNKLDSNRQLKQPTLYFFAFLTTIILVAVTELIQIFDPLRNLELIDFVRGILGALCFLSISAGLDKKMEPFLFSRPIIMKKLLVGFAILMLIGGLFPLLQVANIYSKRDSDFPLLMNFDDPWVIKFITIRGGVLEIVQRPDIWPLEYNKKVGKFSADLNTDWPFLRIDEVTPDWNQYKILEINIYLESKYSQSVTLLIDDKHVRGNRRHPARIEKTLLPGFNRLHIPLRDLASIRTKNILDLTEVNRIWIAFPDHKKVNTYYFGDIKLIHTISATESLPKTGVLIIRDFRLQDADLCIRSALNSRVMNAA